VISFRTKADTGASIAIIVAIIVLMGTAVVMIFIPPPSTAGIVAGKARSEKEIVERIRQLKSDEIAAKTVVAAQTWTDSAEEIGPKALAFITSFAQKNRLKLIAFRPQKAVEVNSMDQLPFLISVEGPFPGVMGILQDLEDPALKLGTSLVQISSSDPSSDLVSATIGIVAYRNLDVKKTTTVNTNAAK
jgi:hypothetical protein